MVHEKLQRWIHSLYLNIILPPDRDPNPQLREERASSVDVFLLTLSSFVRELGFPAHVVSLVLGELLANVTVVTKATLSNDSSASISARDNSAKKKYNIFAFQSELANQTAILMQNNMLGSRILATGSLLVASASRYELTLKGVSPKWAANWDYHFGGRASSVALGFMLKL